jgi:hypothetical protein
LSPKSVDFKAVRVARARLDALVDSHPERIQESPHAGNAVAWVDVLEVNMAKDTKQRVAEYREKRKRDGQVQLDVWLPADLVAVLDARARDTGASRSDVLTEALRTSLGEVKNGA